MARTATNTVIALQYNEVEAARPVYERPAADGNILPGHLLVLASDGDVDSFVSAAATSVQPMVALANQYADAVTAGANLTTAFTAGELVPYIYPQPGDCVYLLVGASASIAIGDQIETGANGLVQERTTGQRIGVAEEAVTTGAGETARVKVRIG